MKITEEMYGALFNGITDALEQIERVKGDIAQSENILKQAQLKAEDLYIKDGDEDLPNLKLIKNPKRN